MGRILGIFGEFYITVFFLPEYFLEEEWQSPVVYQRIGVGSGLFGNPEKSFAGESPEGVERMDTADTFKAFLIILGVIVLCSRFNNSLARQAELPVNIGEVALEYALEQEGKPYIWGGRDPRGFDCSGLVVWAYRQARPGIKFKNGRTVGFDATADTLFYYNVVPLANGEIRPGDLMFFTCDAAGITHVGLFIRWINECEFEMLHVSTSRAQVVRDVWPLMGKKGNEWFVGAGRLLVIR